MPADASWRSLESSHSAIIRRRASLGSEYTITMNFSVAARHRTSDLMIAAAYRVFSPPGLTERGCVSHEATLIVICCHLRGTPLRTDWRFGHMVRERKSGFGKSSRLRCCFYHPTVLVEWQLLFQQIHLVALCCGEIECVRFDASSTTSSPLLPLLKSHVDLRHYRGHRKLWHSTSWQYFTHPYRKRPGLLPEQEQIDEFSASSSWR